MFQEVTILAAVEEPAKVQEATDLAAVEGQQRFRKQEVWQQLRS